MCQMYTDVFRDACPNSCQELSIRCCQSIEAIAAALLCLCSYICRVLCCLPCCVLQSQYASIAGIVGVVAYAISCGLPILMIGGFGGRITRDLPHVFSLADFVGWRFGPIAKTLLFIMSMFMMCIFVLAEYTTIGTIFSAFVGTLDWPIIVVVGVLTLTYTAYGGLAVSIATDQIQGCASLLLALILTIYVAVTYRCVGTNERTQCHIHLAPWWFALCFLSAGFEQALSVTRQLRSVE